MKTLIAFIFLWVGSETNYNVNLPEPNIVKVSEQKLISMYYGNQPAESKVHALYDPDTDTIYLKDSFNEYDVFDKGILMHELMHYIHDMNGAVGKKFKCMAQSEAEIYPLQKKYLLEVHGVKWDYDPMYLKVISSCEKTR